MGGLQEWKLQMRRFFLAPMFICRQKTSLGVAADVSATCEGKRSSEIHVRLL